MQIVGSSEPVKGFRNVVLTVGNVKSKGEELVIEDQWIEYAATNAAYLQNLTNLMHILKVRNVFCMNN